jgi:hypothetical protein
MVALRKRVLPATRAFSYRGGIGYVILFVVPWLIILTRHPGLHARYQMPLMKTCAIKEFLQYAYGAEQAHAYNIIRIDVLTVTLDWHMIKSKSNKLNKFKTQRRVVIRTQPRCMKICA